VARLNPEVLNSLNKIQRQNRLAAVALSPANLRSYLAGKTSGPRFDRYISAVRKWGKRWHLVEPWCFEYAMHTAWSWTTGDSQQKWCFLHDEALAPSFATGRINWPDVGNWDPVRQTRIDFLDDAMKFVRAAIESYCDKIEEDVRTAGLSKARPKREINHFYWSAGYQVRGWSCQQIADAENKTRRSVEEPVKALAASIGLNLRESKNYDSGQTETVIREALRRAIAPSR